MLSVDDNSQEIEIIKEDKKPQSLVKILIVMFFSIALLGVAVIGGLKFYKQYKNKKLKITEQSIPLEQNNTYVESLARPQQIPGPPQLKIPENLEQPMLIKKVEENTTDTTDYSKLPYDENQVESKTKEKTLPIANLPQHEIPKNLEQPMLIKKVEENITDTTDYSKVPYTKNQVELKEKEKTLQEKLDEISNFDELKEAIDAFKIRRVKNEIIVGNKTYKRDENLGSNFIIKKMYRNGNVKIFSIKENYSRRFSL